MTDDPRAALARSQEGTTRIAASDDDPVLEGGPWRIGVWSLILAGSVAAGFV